MKNPWMEIVEMLYEQSIELRMKNPMEGGVDIIWSINISLNKNEKSHGGGGKIVEMLYDQSI